MLFSVGPSLIAAGLAAELEADDVYTHVYGPEKAAVLTRLGAAVYVGDPGRHGRRGHGHVAHAVGVSAGVVRRRRADVRRGRGGARLLLEFAAS